ncbi:MAG: VWA domain-containing protein [Bacteroidota bacterium]|nr:VWA domain-containing protein [Bacteroidota bacterium]MDX5505296.1 VWA domain-containing protein [Bacteroidota bacterium]
MQGRSKFDKEQLLEEDLERFIRFGNILDTATRRYLVFHLRRKFDADIALPKGMKENYLEYFTQALDDIFQDESLIKLGTEHRIIGLHIIRDTVQFFRKALSRNWSRHPYQRELSDLESWTVRPFDHLFHTYPTLIAQVGSYHTSEEIPLFFYRDKLRSLLHEKSPERLTPDERRRVDILINDLLGQWDARLQARILEWELNNIHEDLDQFRQQLEGKARDLKKVTDLLDPFRDYLHRHWDVTEELLTPDHFNILEEYRQLLEDEESLRKLADILGRLRQAEIESSEEEFERTYIRRREETDPQMRSEIEGTHTSGDIRNMLSHETVLLADPELSDFFLQRFANSELQTHRFSDRRIRIEHDEISETKERTREKKKGPFIICVDTSGSMEGAPERIAKILCFGILKMAIREDRPAYLINFSSGVKTVDLSALGQSLPDLVQFLQFSFHGGTDVSLALHEALEQLEEKEYRDADVLVISDFIMFSISDEVLKRMKSQQLNQNTQFHNLTISDEANSEIISHFDNHWVYDPEERKVFREMFHPLKEATQRRI